MAGGPASHTRLESVGSLLVVFVLAEKKGVNQKGKGKFTCGSAGGEVSRRENFYLLAAQASASWEGYTGQVMMEGARPAGLGSTWELPGSGVSTIPVASFASVPPRKRTVLFSAPWSGFALRSPGQS